MARHRTDARRSKKVSRVSKTPSSSAVSFLETLGRPVFALLFFSLKLILSLFPPLFSVFSRLLKTGLTISRFFLNFLFFLARNLTFLLLLPFKILLKTFSLLRSFSRRHFHLPVFSFSFRRSRPGPKHPSRPARLPRPPRPPRPGHPKLKKALLWLTSLLLFIAVLSAGIYFYLLKDLPHPEKLITRPQPITTRILDRKGRLLYKIYRQQNRTLIKLENLPSALIQATIAIEDAEFYQHHGFSLKGILRSVAKNLAEGKLQGGSTITQQLVKNALLNSEKTFTRKFKELILSIQTEIRFTKEEILQMYLNEVGYGGATYGAEEAAWKYFGKSARQLSLAESALLSGLPASPTRYSPFGTHPELAKSRQRQVLQRMVAEGFITPAQADAAAAEELIFQLQSTDIQAPHFVMYVKNQLVENYGEQLVEEGGLEVITSLDLDLQQLAEKIVHEEVGRLSSLNVTNGASLITRPETGEILAMVGSKDYFDLSHDGNVNVTVSLRQPGSSIKPLNYAVAFNHGYTPSSLISDSPVSYQIPGQAAYSPKNYDGRFHGQVSLRTALASSYNVPAVKLLASYGIDNLVDLGRKLGITTWEDSSRFGLALTLGGGDIKMVDMAVAYGTFANLGHKVNLQPILQVTDSHGKILQPYPSGFKDSQEKSVPELDPRIAYLINHILADNQARTPAFGPHSLLYLPGKTVAVKTGTTNQLRDNWTFGYTPDYLVAAWVGNNDNSPMSQVASGVTGASSIWNRLMSTLLADQPDHPFPVPEGIIEKDICPYTNTLPCQGCTVKKELFIAGTEPQKHCFLTPTPAAVREQISSAVAPAAAPVDNILWEKIER